MATGSVQVYYGAGRGKSTAALGRSILAASAGKTVFIIQFLKGKTDDGMEFLKRLEPEIKIFRFEKSEEYFNELSEEEQMEEVKNIKNGLNFAKTGICTGGCDLLILDEVLRLIDNGIISVEELKGILDMRSDESMDVIMTGTTLSADVCVLADEVTRLATVKGGL